MAQTFDPAPEQIKAWVKANFPDCKSIRGGDELAIRNPFDGSTKYKFQISCSKGICHCWTGDLWAGKPSATTGKRNCSFMNFVRLYKHCTMEQAIKEVIDVSAGIQIADRAQDDLPVISVQLPDGLQSLHDADSRQAAMLQRWLIGRGYTHSEIKRQTLLYRGMEVCWPFYEYGELVYYQMRSRLNKRFAFPSSTVNDAEGKPIASIGVGKGDFFYGFDEVKDHGYVIIVESIFNRQVIMDQTLASGGAILTEKQVQKLRLLSPVEGIILAPDNDEAGIKSLADNYRALLTLDYPICYSLPPRLPYLKDGQQCFSSDWNEMYEFCHVAPAAIKAALIGGIRSLNEQSLVGLTIQT
jgi:hypothetical protein